MKTVILLVPNSPLWLGPCRADIFAKVLKDAGYNVRVYSVGRSRLINEEWIEDADLILNHTIVASENQIRKLATENPHKVFVHINHSAYAQTEKTAKDADKMTASLFSVKALENIWYGTVCRYSTDLAKALGCPRCIHFPAPGHLLTPREYRAPSTPVRAVLGGRCNSIKNHFNQIIALKLLGCVELHLAMDPSKQLLNLIKVLELPVKLHGRLPHPRWITLLKEMDLCFSVSIAESFCFVASEAMQLGVPTISNECVSFSDPLLRAHINDPSDIKEKAQYALDNYQECSKRSYKLANDAVKQREIDYVNQVKRLLGEPQWQ